MNWIAKIRREYARAHWLQSLISKANGRVCFFIPEKSKGWILEAACREVAQRMVSPYVFCDDYKGLPLASAYFFCHYHFYKSALSLNPWLAEKNCIVWFTHPKEPGLGGQETIDALNTARVVTMCSKWRQYLIELGVEQERVSTIVGAADLQFFQPHQRGGGRIGFCTAYYERKNPDRILEIIRMMPDQEFVLMGRNWREYPRFGELFGLGNLEYRETKYSQYPKFYNELDVFVSASQLEGGPIPLLESMMSNVVPVASDTGFAPDVIRHGENGFLFPAEDQDPAIVVDLIREAKRLQTDVRQSVIQYSWDAYTRNYEQLFRAA
ncbi:glycosyltransferase family 4 protein [Blastopirellula sp. JC732]|uniref:Glycosyltransferase family 4 protein n=1 Tax=Blastopirellula sediminis TaxID=2894196 RepID=A0A9X1SFD1_9BACT|nr:glycosyltransferase family 4 protein [Blastopirellula sediminis]MCC9609597.1 glycosyltransferase family 4 protein [Blastopirellula sediminis]MCC9627627.1 glycosyltransferase family 4 protein [Blastopirellula sediminis]